MRLLAILLICFYSAFSQSALDSLRTSLDSADGEERLELLLEVAESTYNSNPSQAIETSKLAFQLAETFNDVHAEAKALFYIGMAYFTLEDFDLGLINLESAAAMFAESGDTKMQATALNQTGNIYDRLKNHDKSFHFHDRALTLRREIDDMPGIAESLNDLGLVKWRLGEFDQAKEYYLEALEINEAIEYTRGIALVSNNLGILEWHWGNYEKALEYYLMTLRVREESKDTERLPLVLNNIGLVYKMWGKDEEALDYFTRALDIADVSGLPLGRAYSLNNMAGIYVQRGDYHTALEYFQRSLDLYDEAGNSNGVTINLNGIGDVYRQLGEYAQSLDYFLRALEVGRRTSNRFALATATMNISRNYLALEDYEQAIEYAKQSQEIALQEGMLDIVKTNFENLSIAYARTDNYREAYESYTSYTEVKDSLFNEQSSKYIAEMQALYDTEKKEKENELLRAANEQQRVFIVVVIILIAIIGIVILNRYYTKTKANRALEEQYQFLQTLIDSIPNPIFFMNKEQQFIGCNANFSLITGKAKDEIINHSAEALNHPEIVEISRKDNALLTSKNLIHFERQLELPDGSRKVMVIYKAAFRDSESKIAGYIGIMMDITERKEAEEALRDSENHLREVNATKDKFFSIIAHDLKNPFVTLLGYSELLTEDYEELGDSERKEFIQHIYTLSKNTYLLLENLLYWARSQSGRIEIFPEEISLTNIAMKNVGLLEGVAVRKNITLVSEVPENFKAYADADTVMTVVRNLVSNAVKFTAAGGKVTITGSANGNQVSVAVTDTGVGMSEEVQRRIFRPNENYTTEGTNHERGTGLGLLLVKEFVEKNGGKIEVKSAPGKGSSFIFSLPKSK